MKRILLILALMLAAVPCLAQTAPPIPVEPCSGKAASGNVTCVFGQNVTSGLVIICTGSWFTGTSPSIADTRSSTWSSVDSANLQTMFIHSWITSLGSSGAETVTLTLTSGTFGNLTCGEYKNLTTTIDGHGTGSFSGTPSSFNTTGVTAASNGGLYYVAAGGLQNSGQFGVDQPLQFHGFINQNDSAIQAWKLTGTNGSYSSTIKNVTNTAGIYIEFVVKSAASLTVTTTALPDCAASSFYTYTLGAEGGSGSYTWAKTSGTLPLGLSLSSGGVLSGTPTAGAANSSLTFQVTDGASATASATLTLHLGGSLQTITFSQSNHTATTSISGTIAASSNVTAGRLLVATAVCGGTLPDNLINSPTDTVGTVWTQGKTVQWMANVPDVITFWYGLAGGSGADTVNGNGPSCVWHLLEVSNAQNFIDFDDVTLGSGATGSTTITSGNSTTPVVNELLDSTGYGFTQASALVIQTYTDIGQNKGNGKTGGTDDGYNFSTSTGTYSVTFNISGNTDGHWSIVLFGFRPTVTGTAPLPPNGIFVIL